MKGERRIFGIIGTVLIVILALIHLGVSISILAKFHGYGSVFRPEIGLASFNLIISLYAILIGVLGVFSVLTYQQNMSEIVGCAAIPLAVFTMASLITALVIHSLSIDYVSSRFSAYMMSYATDQDSQNIINDIQINYDCCGTNTWLDWANVQLNSTGNGATGTTNSGAATTNAAGGATQGAATTTKATNSATQGAATTANSAGGATQGAATTTKATAGTTKAASDRSIRSLKRFIDTVVNDNDGENADAQSLNNVMKNFAKNFFSSVTMTDVFKFKRSPSEHVVRRKRDTQTYYGGIYGLPTSYSVTLPSSCCDNTLSGSTSSSSSYCISNANNVSNSIRTDGCSKKLAQSSIGQTIGISVINSFLFCIVLATVPLLFNENPLGKIQDDGVVYQAGTQYQPQYGQMGYPASYQHPYMQYDNNNAAYGMYL